ncbi:hypothetical protein [Cytobacillus sp.]|uniref:hypothetical protein n=1 Tax=Cytobacillus sp. TaxID=2675269 RepID=UPI0028BF4EA8|nr:hypothetical protein [Cytobacillus sp.]
MSSRSKKNTITTGPFLIPEVIDGFENNRLVITIKNPTNRPLEAEIVIETCPRPPAPITLPFISNIPEIPVPIHFGPSIVPPMNCTRIELDIFDFEGASLRVTSRGDYLVGEDRPLCGKLEIEVIGGQGSVSRTTLDLAPGLFNADPSLIFHYGDFIVCKRKEESC